MSPDCTAHELIGDICWKCGYIRGEPENDDDDWFDEDEDD